LTLFCPLATPLSGSRHPKLQPECPNIIRIPEYYNKNLGIRLLIRAFEMYGNKIAVFLLPWDSKATSRASKAKRLQRITSLSRAIRSSRRIFTPSKARSISLLGIGIFWSLLRSRIIPLEAMVHPSAPSGKAKGRALSTRLRPTFIKKR
jgi:hypothetical protein